MNPIHQVSACFAAVVPVEIVKADVEYIAPRLKRHMTNFNRWRLPYFS